MAAAKKKDDDPVVSTDVNEAPEYPEGTHPARPPAETHHSASRIKYEDNPDKPDPSSIAQVAVFPEDWN